VWLAAASWGKLLAFALVNAKHEVMLFDNNYAKNCSEVAAGLLSPIAELTNNPQLIFALGSDAITLHWPKI